MRGGQGEERTRVGSGESKGEERARERGGKERRERGKERRGGGKERRERGVWVSGTTETGARRGVDGAWVAVQRQPYARATARPTMPHPPAHTHPHAPSRTHTHAYPRTRTHPHAPTRTHTHSRARLGDGHEVVHEAAANETVYHIIRTFYHINKQTGRGEAPG